MLCTTTAAIGLSAGCLADDASQPADDDGDDATDDDNGSPTDGSEDDPDPVGDAIEDLPDGLADVRTLTYQSPASSEPDITVLRDAERAAEWLDEREALHNADAVATFIDATDFETSILVSLSDEAPTPCYEVVIEAITIEAGESSDSDSSAGETETSDSDEHSVAEDETLVLEAAVHETAEDQVCAQSITTVGRLVRVTFESEPLTTVSATLVGHDGSTYDTTMGSDSGSASASSTVESEWDSGSESQSSDS
ncbi:hypothetical protein [Natrinema limicola]|uniref:Uncharacterized protein n=1 Tax=Natrinema limicola JCM 13563 TaxID=1230457 RepID=M0CQR4_9EURY|nr:hypothetical protein [Natrinema limicola]ELZ24747.1 hypothetical protein C476_03823 [Natrinema limicola JCM 13563]